MCIYIMRSVAEVVMPVITACDITSTRASLRILPTYNNTTTTRGLHNIKPLQFSTRGPDFLGAATILSSSLN